MKNVEMLKHGYFVILALYLCLGYAIACDDGVNTQTRFCGLVILTVVAYLCGLLYEKACLRTWR